MKTTLTIMVAAGIGAGALALLKKYNPECIAYVKGYFNGMNTTATANIENMM